MYTRREFGKLMLAGLPLSMALGARFPGRRRSDRRPVLQFPHAAAGRSHQGNVRYWYH